MYRCPYCQTNFATGLAPEPTPSTQPSSTQQGPMFVILTTGHGHDDDDDDDGHRVHRHSMPHAAPHVATSSFSWIVWLVVVFVVVGASGGGWRFFRHRSLGFALGSAWDGSAPFHCTGNEQIAVKNVHAEFNAGTAVSVSGNCHFTCTDCTIKAPTVIEVGGNGNVVIVNGTVAGSETLVDASGNARVNISGNVTSAGAVKQSSNAKVSAPKSAAPASSSTAATPTPPPAAAAPPSPSPRAAVSAPVTTKAAAPKASAKAAPKK